MEDQKKYESSISCTNNFSCFGNSIIWYIHLNSISVYNLSLINLTIKNESVLEIYEIIMKNLSIIILVFLSYNCFAQEYHQNNSDAKPIIGWDSLRVLIEKPEIYPEIYRRAMVTRTFTVT